jgi:hypothetical protein
MATRRHSTLGLKKGLENLECLRRKLVAITAHFAGFEAQSLNVHAGRSKEANSDFALSSG